MRRRSGSVLQWQKRLTMNLALSDSCCATCLASTAPVYSLLKVRFVMDTSSSSRLKYFARAVSNVRMSLLTTCTACMLPKKGPCGCNYASCNETGQSATDVHTLEARAHLTHGEKLTGVVLRDNTLQSLLHG